MGKRVILSSEYRKMLEADDKRRFAESHSAFLNYQAAFIADDDRRRREWEEERKRRFQESQTEFIDYQKKYLDEMSL